LAKQKKRYSERGARLVDILGERNKRPVLENDTAALVEMFREKHAKVPNKFNFPIACQTRKGVYCSSNAMKLVEYDFCLVEIGIRGIPDNLFVDKV